MSDSTVKQTTKERLILTAEKLFAEKGFRDVSLRDITEGAGANVASVNYHFQSKDALEDEVVLRHIIPVNQARMSALKSLQDEYGEEAIPLRSILLAFLRPMMERMHSSSLRSDLFAKIMGRCMGDKGRALPEKFEKQVKAVITEFQVELTRSLPQLSVDTVIWRLHFSFGVVAHTLLFADRVAELSEVRDASFEASLERIVDYCEGGLLAEDRADEKEGSEE